MSVPRLNAGNEIGVKAGAEGGVGGGVYAGLNDFFVNVLKEMC